MTDRQKALRRLQMEDFAMRDAQLFLDSNPNDAQALSYFATHKAEKEEALRAYEAQYGPIRYENNTGDYWQWTEGPWPWESEAN